MRILVVSNMYPCKSAPAFGSFVQRIVGELRDQGFHIDICTRCKDSGWRKLLSYLRLYVRSAWRCTFGGYDIVYVHYASLSALGVLVARWFGSTAIVVANVHGSDVVADESTEAGVFASAKSVVSAWLAGRLLKAAALVVYPSAYFMRVVGRAYGVPVQRSFVSPSGGIDLDRFRLRQDRGSRCCTLLFLGRLVPRKGIMRLLDAVASVAPLRPHLIIGGDGPLREIVETRAAALAPAVTIEVRGEINPSDVPAFMTGGDVFVFSSSSAESLGLTLLEAMAAGLPVVAACNGPTPEIVTDGVDGWLYGTDTPDGLRAALERALTTPTSALEQMGDNARAAVDRFSATRTGTELAERLRMLLSEAHCR